MDKMDQNKLNLEKAVMQLAKALDEPKSEYVRDAAIQRFEFTYELLWKVLKSYLEKIHGIRVISPRQVFKEAFALDIIGDEMLFLNMIESRNLIAHTYNEDQAEKVYTELKIFLPEIKRILAKIQA